MNGSSVGLLKDVPDAWGPKIETQAGAVTHTRTGPNEIGFSATSHMALILLTPQPDRVRSLNSDRKSVFMAPIGTVEIIPVKAEMFARWKTTKENLLFALAPDRLSTLAGLEFGRDDFEFRATTTGCVDQKALMLANLIREEFRSGEPSNHLYVDSLITVFSTYLLRNYSTLQDRPSPQLRGGLPPRIWRDVENYIRSHIGEPLSIEQLARIANLSPSHFLRAFRQTTGSPPHKFVLATRIETAERMLLTTDMPLALIASLTGFSNHSHMTAAMKQYRALTPSALRHARVAD
ncbi:helix-turn-helix domain-containing protein [Agrobacterium tumefaciens]|uniref:helix-turn-helix domain-containing protein n=1 Tax=Agrobacterium tumefaciens TaxID=358 RepID=UPI000ACECD21|nr:AraC family transcriptional regulator [Agrobacterium tumefaciens]